MRNRIDVFLSSLVRMAILFLFFSLSFYLTTVFVYAADSVNWITMAEESCIYENRYTVRIKTEVFLKPVDNNMSSKSDTRTSGSLIERSSARFEHTTKHGLRKLRATQGSPNDITVLPANSVFILDVSKMLRKMNGKVQWILEDDQASIENQACVILSSSGEKWLVRLWINKRDGTVLRYDQYIKDRYIGSSILKYGQPENGKYLPIESTTQFYLTGHVFRQKYDEYSFLNDIK